MSRDPIRLDKAITELMAIRGFNRVNANKQLAETWNEVAGPAIAKGSKAISLRSGILQVSVSTSAMLGELKSFHHMQLLSGLQKKDPNIRDIRYRLNSNLKTGKKPG